MGVGGGGDRKAGWRWWWWWGCNLWLKIGKQGEINPPPLTATTTTTTPETNETTATKKNPINTKVRLTNETNKQAIVICLNGTASSHRQRRLKNLWVFSRVRRLATPSPHDFRDKMNKISTYLKQFSLHGQKRGSLRRKQGTRRSDWSTARRHLIHKKRITLALRLKRRTSNFRPYAHSA